MGKNQKPADDAGNDGKDEKHDEDGAVDHVSRCRRGGADLMGDERQYAANGGDGDGRRHAITSEPCGEFCHQLVGQERFCDRRDLIVELGLRLAHVMAAAVQRAAERTDRRRIGRTPCHVFRLERVFADGAGDGAQLAPFLARLAGQIEFALRAPGDQRRGDEGDDEGEIGR
ncbi:hypothetical protein D3C87_1103930 [compost metagenome]